MQAASEQPEAKEQGRQHRFQRLHDAHSSAHGALRSAHSGVKSGLTAARTRLGRLFSGFSPGSVSFGHAWQSFWGFLSVCWEWLAAKCEGLWHVAASGLQAGGARLRSLAPRQAQPAGAS